MRDAPRPSSEHRGRDRDDARGQKHPRDAAPEHPLVDAVDEPLTKRRPREYRRGSQHGVETSRLREHPTAMSPTSANPSCMQKIACWVARYEVGPRPRLCGRHDQRRPANPRRCEERTARRAGRRLSPAALRGTAGARRPRKARRRSRSGRGAIARRSRARAPGRRAVPRARSRPSCVSCATARRADA